MAQRWKKILSILGFFLFLDLPLTSADSIDNDKPLLKEIAQRIIAQPDVFNSIKEKLRKYHSQQAINVWSSYNKDTLPKAAEPEYKGVLVGNLRSAVRKDILGLVGKTTNTFYTDIQINSIEMQIQSAVANGTPNISDRSSNIIEITYDLGLNFGERWEKNDVPPFAPRSILKTSITIVLVADQFLKDIEKNGKGAWKNKKELQGCIYSVY
jgi:hypothetical protein